MVLALVAALGSAICYGLGSVLQSVGARRVRAGDRLDPRLLARVATQGPYLLGLGLDATGGLLSLAALVLLPVYVVQSVVAASIGFVVAFAALIERVRPTRRQLAFLAVLVLGLFGLGVSGAPESATAAPAGFTAAMWAAVLLIGLAGVAAPRRLTPEHAAAVLGALAGLAFGGTALCARSLSTDLGVATVWDPLTWALVGFGVLGLSFYAAGLQRGTVTVVTAWVCTTETVAPAVIGLAVLGDGARHGLGAVAVVSFVVTVAAAVGLSLVSPPVEATAPPPAAP
jgi:drug/metabolite transporter (DMT)-like permease